MSKAVDPKLKQLLRSGGAFDPDTGRDLLSAAAADKGLAWWWRTAIKRAAALQCFGRS